MSENQGYPYDTQHIHRTHPRSGASIYTFVDYDGESLSVSAANDEGMWVRYQGEGPVYLSVEDAKIFIEEFKKKLQEAELNEGG